MGYDRVARKAIRKLSDLTTKQVSILENSEKGQMLHIPELCQAIEGTLSLIAFSCLSGGGEKQELDLSLGEFFSRRKVTETQKLLHSLGNKTLTVILDDCEPCRVWQWTIPQTEISGWCEMVIGDSIEKIPNNWRVQLWSELENQSNVAFESVLAEIRKPDHALSVHHHLEHMRKFPNKKLIGNMREAAIRRVASYALQGIVLESILPTAILLQSETPWAVKDPLYQPLRKVPLPIVHPFEERR